MCAGLRRRQVSWAGSLPPEVVEHRLRQNLNDAGLPPEQVVTALRIYISATSGNQAGVSTVGRRLRGEVGRQGRLDNLGAAALHRA